MRSSSSVVHERNGAAASLHSPGHRPRPQAVRPNGRSIARPLQPHAPGTYSGPMTSLTPDADSGFARGAARLAGGARRTFIAYARWLDSISWKRFILLSILALITAGVVSHLPPFSTEFGGRTEVIEGAPPVPPTPKAPVVIRGKSDIGDGYDINIEKGGVHITPRLPARAASAASATAPEAAEAGAALSSALAGADADAAEAARAGRRGVMCTPPFSMLMS